MRSLTSANTIAMPRSAGGRHGGQVAANRIGGVIGSAAPMEEVAGAQDTIYLCNFRVSVDGEWLCLKELQDLDLQDAATTQQQHQQPADDCGGMGGVAVVGGHHQPLHGNSGGGGIVVNYGISSVQRSSEGIERSDCSHYCRWLVMYGLRLCCELCDVLRLFLFNSSFWFSFLFNSHFISKISTNSNIHYTPKIIAFHSEWSPSWNAVAILSLYASCSRLLA